MATGISKKGIETLKRLAAKRKGKRYPGLKRKTVRK